MAKVLSFLRFVFHPVALALDLIGVIVGLSIIRAGALASSGRPYTWTTTAALLVVLLTMFLLGYWAGRLAERDRAQKIGDGMAGLIESIGREATGSTKASALAPHQQRVVDEKAELDDLIRKLAAFIDTSDKGFSVFSCLTEPERMRLYAQHRAMTVYSTILGERIAAFGSAA